MEHLAPDSAVEALAALMRGRRTLVLSGVGISTESGIPDYRGPRGALRSRRPMQYREFVGSEEARGGTGRAAPWAARGLPEPDPTPATPRLPAWRRPGASPGVITQNVDSV